MTLDGAEKLTLIASTLGHGLDDDEEVIVGNLVDAVNCEFPQFVWKVGSQATYAVEQNPIGRLVTVTAIGAT